MLHEEIIRNDPDKKIPLREIMSILAITLSRYLKKLLNVLYAYRAG
jgi:hypothetical protein